VVFTQIHGVWLLAGWWTIGSIDKKVLDSSRYACVCVVGVCCVSMSVCVAEHTEPSTAVYLYHRDAKCFGVRMMFFYIIISS
jgi:hypothetical protein